MSAARNHDARVGTAEASEVPCTELKPLEPGSPLFQEWNTYLQQVTRLLAEGMEGKFLLIKGDAILGIFETESAAHAEGVKRFLRQPFLVHQVRTCEPILRLRGYNLPWPSLPSPSQSADSPSPS